MRKTITIANVKGRKYSEPKVVTNRGYTYILYIENRDLILSKFDGKDSEQVAIIKSANPYQTSLYKKNDILYLCWGVQGGGSTIVKCYSYGISNQTLKCLYESDIIDCKNIEDLRVVVDNNANIFITFTAWIGDGNANQQIICKYGDNIEKRIIDEKGNDKHGDIACNNKYVYSVRQDKIKGDNYGITIERKENKYNGKWEKWKTIDTGHVQRPRFCVTNEIIHVIYHVGIDPNRQILYKSSKNNFESKTLVSPAKLAGYGSIDICSENEHNVFVSMRKGREIIYNKMLEGRWVGAKVLLKDRFESQASFLDSDKFSVTFCSRNESVRLVQDGKLEYEEVEQEVEEPDIEPEVETIPEPEPAPEARKIDDEKLREVIPKMKIIKAINDNKFIKIVKKYIKEIGSFLSGLGLGWWIF